MEDNKISFEKKTVNGKEIEFIDVMHHETVTVFDWKDRIRILFGRPTRTVSQIYTKNTVIVSGSEAQVYVTPLIKRKRRVMGLVAHNGRDFAAKP